MPLLGEKEILFIFGLGIFGLVLNGGLFVFAIISDARFSLFVLISSQLIVFVEFLNFAKGKLNPKFFRSSVKAKTER